MSSVKTADGVALYCEESGEGTAILFVHEYGGSCRSFDMQTAAFRARYRCVVFNARGYPPSEVPASVDSYSQDHAVTDIGAVMDSLGVKQAHLVGVSMGAASSLQYALKEPGGFSRRRWLASARGRTIRRLFDRPRRRPPNCSKRAGWRRSRRR